MRGKERETQNTKTTPRRNRLPKPNSLSFHSPAYINPEFTHRRHWHLLTTTLYSLSSTASATPWLYAAVDGDEKPPQLLHPLTLKPHHFNTPINLDLSRSVVTSFKHTDFPFDKVVIPPARVTTVDRDTMVVLCGGGHLVARLPLVESNNRVKWVSLSERNFDDIIISKGISYVVDTSGELFSILDYIKGKLLRRQLTLPDTFGSCHVRYRKRLVPDFEELYLVVRLEAEVFKVCKRPRDYRLNNWDVIKEFDSGRVLFVSKDCCFFVHDFGMKEYENCIVFTGAGFPRYGDDGWEYNGEDDIMVFRMSDGRYGKVGESVDFPQIDWSPPSCVFDVREPDEDDGMREQEERSDLNIRDVKGGKMQFDSNRLEPDDEEMQCNANIEGDASLQQDVLASFASISAFEEEVTRTLLLMNGGNVSTNKETSMENNKPSAPRACTSSSTNKRYKSDFATTKFEGFDIRSGSVPTLQKIWRNHGNIIESCPIHSSAIIANALESLATAVQILENNSVESLTECQADYLSTTLSDLRFMCFKVDWLSSFVEKAVKLLKGKALVDSLKKLGQLSSQVKESRAEFLDKAAKLLEEEKKLEKEMARVSKLIPLSGDVKFDEPFGSGLT